MNRINLRLIKRIIILLILVSFLIALPHFAGSETNVEEFPELELVLVPTPPIWQETFATLPADLQRTALCESDVNGDGVPDVDAKNPRSSASGIFQVIDGTFAWVWKELYDTPVDFSKKNDPFIQIEIAKWLYAKYGLSQWQYPCGTLMA